MDSDERHSYSPNAITDDGTRLFTTCSTYELEKAVEQFRIWEDHYKYRISLAWIDVDEDKRFEYRKTWTADGTGLWALHRQWVQVNLSD